ncbi:hypothetical protein NHE_0867 [Neorickettsia helminthoeca str. Oregon]|uniref:Uncharacterized protein n=1 Tax=Neorickettsia helminthoeca str. Oregon TaxID=1286528 RepID=X5H5C1_9RICK|nr:hypothetical protein [Neorickettsia helminthoeca]AHX11786.1 hypothetical protein NHE_0867 [Neorickettsia helminthoeca str. Oregon]
MNNNEYTGEESSLHEAIDGDAVLHRDLLNSVAEKIDELILLYRSLVRGCKNTVLFRIQEEMILEILTDSV